MPEPGTDIPDFDPKIERPVLADKVSGLLCHPNLVKPVPNLGDVVVMWSLIWATLSMKGCVIAEAVLIYRKGFPNWER